MAQKKTFYILQELGRKMKKVNEMTSAVAAGNPSVMGGVIRSPAELVMGKIKKVQKGLKKFKKEVKK